MVRLLILLDFYGSFVDPFGFLWFVVEEIPGENTSDGDSEKDATQ